MKCAVEEEEEEEEEDAGTRALEGPTDRTPSGDVQVVATVYDMTGGQRNRGWTKMEDKNSSRISDFIVDVEMQVL